VGSFGSGQLFILNSRKKLSHKFEQRNSLELSKEEQLHIRLQLEKYIIDTINKTKIVKTVKTIKVVLYLLIILAPLQSPDKGLQRFYY